jgi:NADH:ubiquinone oxidoreductase subunit 6 (subunit J)
MFQSTLLLIIFGLFVAATIAGALLAVGSVRLIRGVCGLAICSVGMAGIYYFLRSPFLALMEILIYIGAVCVTIVFAIMLAEPEEAVAEENRLVNRPTTWLWGGITVLACAAIFVGLWQLGTQQNWAAPAVRATDGSLKALGISLLTTYSLAFELISLVLFVAIVGALAIARGGRTKL